MRRYLLEVVVFICGAVVMILELVGSSIVDPYLGTSIIVWTSLIGVILGSLSLGYWWGGRLADKNPSSKKLAAYIFIAALFIIFIAFYKTPILVYLEYNIQSLYVGAGLVTIVLFTVPSVLLGMVLPYAVRLKMQDVAHSGATVGNLYAISTVGSIVGTFLAGFILIALIGSTNILFLLSITLIIASFLLYVRKDYRLLALAAVTTIFGFSMADYVGAINLQPHSVDVDTPYSRVIIREMMDGDNRVMRVLMTNPDEVQSGILLADTDKLLFDYTNFYRLAEHFHPNIEEAVMIGGAGYTFPREFLRIYSDAELAVVEIDPKMTELAKKYFYLEDNPRLHIYHEDGRTFLNRNKKQYDVVYGDAFKSFHALPHHLTTKEAAERIHSALSSDGVYVVNLISATGGDKGKFLRAEYCTFKSVFPQVYLFPVLDKNNPNLVQNIMMVALKSKQQPSFQNNNPELQKFLDHLLTTELPNDMPILTDEYAPVDNYIMELAK